MSGATSDFVVPQKPDYETKQLPDQISRDDDKQQEMKRHQQSDPQPRPSVPSIACRLIAAKSNPTTMRMCPPVTLKNWRFHKPLLAVGNANGVVQIFNLANGKLYRELSVHAYSVKGIEWIGLNGFLSHAESESFQGNDLNWELHVTELDTGRTVQLKSGRSSETSIIQSVKASHLRQYFIIVYQNNSFEIWDLETLSLIRRVSKRGIVAAEWNPLYSKPAIAVKNDAIKSDDAETPVDTTAGATKISMTSSKAHLRENFVVTIKTGELTHFSIAGSVVKEISNAKPDTSITRSVTAIAWKSDHVVLGQNDGNISVWDLGKKESRTVSTMRGSIKKIRFAPGRGNMKIMILFEDGADIWDVQGLRLVSTVITSRGQFIANVTDTDWAASDRPVMLASNGTVVVTDLEFKEFSSFATSYHPDTGQPRGANELPNNETKQDPCNLQ